MADIRVKIMVFQHDGTVVSQYLLGEGVHTIGRDPNSAIYVESEYISNEHAKLHLTDEGIFIEDLNSTSGTFLDDVTVRGKLRLNPDQRLRVGDLYIDLQLEGAGDLSPGVKIGAGRYQLVKELGRGAMGQVWLGQDTQLDELVAIKVLGSDVANNAVSLLDLKREVQKSRKLSHDNIIRIHDLVQLPGENPFISLEYVEGTDLHAIQLNQPDRIFQWADVKPYVLQLCDALDYAHERKIVHRDLKPPNIMITQDGILKLADFGIAASIVDATGRSSMADFISGTPQFMSPQQMLGKSPKASDDIYALGATIYDLLTGRPPFHTGDIAHQVQHVTPMPIEQRLAEFGLQNSVPDYVNGVVMNCLAKDPEARPTSAGAIAEWIRTEGKSDIPAKRKKTKTGVEKITPEEPIQAEVESAAPVEPQPQPAKDKKTPVLAIVAVAAIAVILGVLFLGKSGGKDENQNQGQGLQPADSGTGKTGGNQQAGIADSLKEGLVAYYPFNGNAKDESGNDNDGEVKGPSLTTDRHGKAASAYSFDGAHTIDLPLKTEDAPDQNTLSGWIKVPNMDRHPTRDGDKIVQLIQLNLGIWWYPRGEKRDIYIMYNLYKKDGSSIRARPLPDLPPGFDPSEWCHLAGTYDGETMKLYVNGVPAGEHKPAEKVYPFVHTQRIGSDGATRPVFAQIDDVRIYNRALSADEITALYDLEKPSSETASGAKKPGTLLWEFKAGGGLASSPAIGADGTLYVGSNDNRVYALDGATGAKKWEFETGGDVQSSPAIGADGTVYVGSSGDNKVHALDGKTGAKKWEFETTHDMRSSPAIGPDGTVYIGSMDFKIYALDGDTGAKKWEYQTASFVFSSPAIGADGIVYIGNEEHDVLALDGQTGKKLWNFHTRNRVTSSPAIGADGTVYIGSIDSNVYALDGKTGAKKWEFKTGGIVQSSPAIGADGTVYVGSYDDRVYALNGKTGAKKWEFETGGIVQSSPAIGADGTVYVGSVDNKLYALNGKTGVKLWEFKTGEFKTKHDMRSSPAIGPDGTLYVGSYDDKVYAIKTSSKGLAKSPWPMFGQNAQHTARASAIPNSPEAAAAIEAAIRKAVGKPTGELTKADLEKVNDKLYLRGNKLTDISALAGLTQLKHLNIEGNQLSDLRPLKGLTQLEGINLTQQHGQLTDISPLAGLPQLMTLPLQYNSRIDMSAFKSGFTNLKELYVHENGLSDISALAGLKQLKILYLYGNRIPDAQLTHLAGLTKLESLWLDNNPISDVSHLAGLSELKELNLHSANITDIKPLAGLKKLTKLYLDKNRIADVKPLAGLTQLEQLHLNNNQLTDISALENLNQLQKLYLHNNQITDVRVLAGLKQLVDLWLEGNPNLNDAEIEKLQKELPKCRIRHNATK